MDFFFAALLGMLISICLCMYRSTKQAQPSFAIPFCVAFLAGVGGLLSIYGFSMFGWSFWHKPPGFGDPVPEIIIAYTLFGFAAFVPSLLVVVVYRLMWDE